MILLSAFNVKSVNFPPVMRELWAACRVFPENLARAARIVQKVNTGAQILIRAPASFAKPESTKLRRGKHFACPATQESTTT
jgi:hypothetical protein